jgi:hypothetical protein
LTVSITHSSAWLVRSHAREGAQAQKDVKVEEHASKNAAPEEGPSGKIILGRMSRDDL